MKEKETRKCKQCGESFVPCHPDSEFCSKGCATKYRNLQKLKDGTHNFYNIDRSKIAKDRVEAGTHPFLKGNMSEEALERKAKGISAARKREAENHTHPWQQPSNFIANEYSRSMHVSENRGLTETILYIADTEFENTFKIGWTYDTEIREKDSRTTKIHKVTELLRGTPDFVISLERDIKQKFFKEEYYQLYNSTEVFPNSIRQDVIDFINLTNLQRLSQGGSTS